MTITYDALELAVQPRAAPPPPKHRTQPRRCFHLVAVKLGTVSESGRYVSLLEYFLVSSGVLVCYSAWSSNSVLRTEDNHRIIAESGCAALGKSPSWFPALVLLVRVAS